MSLVNRPIASAASRVLVCRLWIAYRVISASSSFEIVTEEP